MKGKIFTLMGLSILVLITLIGFASATINFVSVTNNGASVLQGNSITITFEAQESGNGNLTNITFNTPITMTSGSNTFTSSNSVTNAITELNESTTSSAMSLTFSVPASQATGTYTGTLTLSGEYTKSVSYDLPITLTVTSDKPEEVITCDSLGNPGSDLRVRHIDITNKGMKTGDSPIEFGDDNSWFSLDDIEVEVEVENKGNDDIDNIEVDWGLWDTHVEEWIIEPHDEKDFDLRDDDSETLTISFNVEKELDIDLGDLDDGDHYKFYIIATGESRENNQDVCANDYENVGMVVERDFVALTNFQFPESVSCGDKVPITAKIWNIGDRDQDDVYVRVYNTELRIDQTVDVGNLDAFERDDFSATIEIPKDTEEKMYLIRFDVYNEDDDIFETDFDKDKADFPVILNVESCKVNVNALVSANLESGGIAGEPLIVKATVVNTGSDSATYDMNADGYSSWATLESIHSTSFTLDSGVSKDVLLAFNVNDDAQGDQVFNIEVTSNGEPILTQPVSVTIEKKSGFARITGGVIGTQNAYLWIIGALNIILVIIIIIVAVRVARK